MHEIELKAWVTEPLVIERMLTHVADFSSHYRKQDSYWTIAGKTIRIREEENRLNNTKKVLVTQKIKNMCNGIEVNNELEFELSDMVLPVFIAILKNTGFLCTAEKEKDTKVFIPRLIHFDPSALTDVRHFSIELSQVQSLGCFIEIELLYPMEITDHAISETVRFENAQKLLYAMLDLLHISYSAIEQRSYMELLKT